MKVQLLPSILRTAYYLWRLQSLDVRSWRQFAEQRELSGARVAIVGNAGYLREMRQGDFIDAHDIVLRMNNFRTAGYAKEVGSKLDIFMTTFHSDVNLYTPELGEARWIVSAMPVNFVKNVGTGLQQRHGDFITAGMLKLGRQTVFAPEASTFLDLRRQIGRYPTTGGLAVAMAVEHLLPVCDCIYFTGFSFFQGAAHYFSDDPVTAANHDLQSERDWIARLLLPKVASKRVRLDPKMAALLAEKSPVHASCEA